MMPFPIRLMSIALCVALLPLMRHCAAQQPAAPPTDANSVPNNSLTDAEQKAGWKLLFDGKTTNGWRSFRKSDINSGWQVLNGALTRVGANAGYIVTTDQYDNFELSLDYNISPGGNSGVMLRVTEEYELPWMSGPEVQIVDNKDGHDPQLTGWVYELYSADVDATHPAGQWNQMRIIVTPQKCEHYVNGVKYCEYVIGDADWNQRVAKSKFAAYPNFSKAVRGHIALQDHNAVVAFRNIKVRPLTETQPDAE